MAVLLVVILYAICLADAGTLQQRSSMVVTGNGASVKRESSDFGQNNASVDPFYAEGYRVGYKKGYKLGYTEGYAYGYERFGGEYQDSLSNNQTDCNTNGTCFNDSKTNVTEVSTTTSGNIIGSTNVSATTSAPVTTISPGKETVSATTSGPVTTTSPGKETVSATTSAPVTTISPGKETSSSSSVVKRKKK